MAAGPRDDLAANEADGLTRGTQADLDLGADGQEFHMGLEAVYEVEGDASAIVAAGRQLQAPAYDEGVARGA